LEELIVLRVSLSKNTDKHAFYLQ